MCVNIYIQKEMAEKSNKRRNSNKNKQIKGGARIGIFINEDEGKYFGKAVFDQKYKFLGKFIAYRKPWLTYLPAGLPDNPRNYRKYHNNGFVYFEDKLSFNKFSIKKIIGLPGSAAETADPNNLADYDKYLKKSGIAMKNQEDDEDDDEDEDWGVDKVQEEPLAQVGGKTKRRNHNRRNNKSKRIRRQ